MTDQHLTEAELEILRLVDRHVIAEWEGELVFADERFVIDPADEEQIMDLDTRKTYCAPQLAKRLREHAQRFGAS